MHHLEQVAEQPGGRHKEEPATTHPVALDVTITQSYTHVAAVTGGDPARGGNRETAVDTPFAVFCE